MQHRLYESATSAVVPTTTGTMAVNSKHTPGLSALRIFGDKADQAVSSNGKGKTFAVRPRKQP